MRFANASLKTAGICWVITTEGISAGSVVSISFIASVPPVEAPMAMTLSVVWISRKYFAGFLRTAVAENFSSIAVSSGVLIRGRGI